MIIKNYNRQGFHGRIVCSILMKYHFSLFHPCNDGVGLKADSVLVMAIPVKYSVYEFLDSL